MEEVGVELAMAERNDLDTHGGAGLGASVFPLDREIRIVLPGGIGIGPGLMLGLVCRMGRTEHKQGSQDGQAAESDGSLHDDEGYGLGDAFIAVDRR